MAITISISDEVWKILNDRKKPGQSFTSVIKEALLELPELKGGKRDERAKDN